MLYDLLVEILHEIIKESTVRPLYLGLNGLPIAWTDVAFQKELPGRLLGIG
jgi:hypothetical protein